MSRWPTGLGRFVFDTIDSTNKEAVRQIDHAPAWVLSYEQTAGVGRRGRAWSTQSGNFAATYITATTEPPAQIALRSFVASLALYDALVSVGVKAADLSLKWPNDVLLKDGKLAGILLETSRIADVTYMSVGIGVNLQSVTETGKIEASAAAPRSLSNDADLDVTPEAFLDALAPAFKTREAQMQTDGFASLRADWLDLAARLGEQITARTPTEEIKGVFTTLDETGAVILETPKGPRAIHAADIFF